jgi:cytoskeletal protein RodZ
VDEPVPPVSVGAAMAAARAKAGLSIDEVSERTRIRATLIRQIEADDFTGCGGAVYARGHIRSIARTLGVAPEPLLESYDVDHDQVPTPVVAPPPEFNPLRHGGQVRGRGGFRWGTAMIFSLVAICILALIMLFWSNSPREGSVGGPAVASATPAAGPPSVPARAPASTAPPTSPPAGVNVRVEARGGQSWLQIRDESQRVVLEQILQQGDSRTVMGRSLVIKMGNAGAIGLSCNGKDLGTQGAPGMVVTVRLDLAATGACQVGGGGQPGIAAGPGLGAAGPAGLLASR